MAAGREGGSGDGGKKILDHERRTFGYWENVAGDEEYRPVSTFMIFPYSFVAGGEKTFMIYKVKFDTTGNKFFVSIPTDSMFNLKEVKNEIHKQTGGIEMAMTYKPVPETHFADLMQSLIYPAVKSKKIRQLKPVEYLGLQIQNIPVDFEKCTSDDIEFFLCREKPILGVNAKKHPNPKTVFVPQLLEDVPQIRSEFSGLPGFSRHFDEMLGENLTGLAYFEAALCGPLQGMYSLHGIWLNLEYGKKGLFLISGEPNLGKTSLARTALSLSSHTDFLYAFNSSSQYVSNLAQKTTCLIIVDDINTANIAMATSMLGYEGAIRGTKKDGATKQVAQILFTENPKENEVREEKLMSGRMGIIVKEFSSVPVETNKTVDLFNQHAHNRTHKLGSQPWDQMIKQCKYWFEFVPAPPAIASRIDSLAASFGYKNQRVDEDGKPVVSQMFLWHCLAADKIYTITAWDSRTLLTWAGLLMNAFILDRELPLSHKWHKEGGSTAMFRDYVRGMLTTSARVSGRVLSNPESSAHPPHLQFIELVEEKVSGLLESGDDDEESQQELSRLRSFVCMFVLGLPGTKGEPVKGSVKGLYLAFIKSVEVNWKLEFGTDFQLSDHSQRMIKEGGHSNYNANIGQGARTRRSVTFPVSKMPYTLQKRVLLTFNRTGAVAAHTKSQLALIASSGIAKEDQENSKMEDSIDIEEDGDQEDGDQEDGDQEDGDQEDGEREDGEREDGEREDGEREDGEREDGDQEDGEREDVHGDDREREDGYGDGDLEDGDQEVGEQEDGDQSDGDQEDGEQEEGNQEDGHGDDREREDGNQEDESLNDSAMQRRFRYIRQPVKPVDTSSSGSGSNNSKSSEDSEDDEKTDVSPEIIDNDVLAGLDDSWVSLGIPGYPLVSLGAEQAPPDPLTSTLITGSETQAVPNLDFAGGADVIIASRSKRKAAQLHSWHGCRKKILKLDLMPGALVHAKYQRYPPWPAKVIRYQSKTKKYELVFLDDNNTAMAVSEKNVSAFIKEPSFLIPKLLRSNWQKYQDIACQLLDAGERQGTSASS